MDVLDRTEPRPLDTRPPRARGLWWVLGGLLAVATVLWVSLNVVALLAHEEHDVTHTFAADGITALMIDNDNGHTEVTGAPPGTATITVNAHITEGLQSPRDRERVVDGRIELRASCPGLALSWCGVAYRVQVPANVTVTINADNGNVTVTNIDGVLKVEDDNGDITVDDVAGELTLTNDNGDVTARHVSSTVVNAENDNGDISLVFIVPPTTVTAENDNGDVRVDVPDTGEAYKVDVKTGNGSERVDVRTDPAASRSITAHTDNGDVRIAYPS